MDASVHSVQQGCLKLQKFQKTKSFPGKAALRGTWQRAQEERVCPLERLAIESLRFYG